MTITIWHNSRCSKSRQALDIMRCRGIEPTVVDYVKNPPSAAQIRRVVDLLGIRPRELMRTGEAVYRERGLDQETDDDALIEAMAHDPILIERPVVIAQDKAVIGRPPENVLELI